MDPLPHIDKVLNNCIHCGMCLPVCPTYALTNLEQSSPRGRIRLMREMYTGKLDLSPTFVDEMYFCLDCQACQTACPAGVRYGELVEDARDMIAAAGTDPPAVRWMRRFFLKGILASPKRTRWFARIFRWYQESGLREAVDSSGILNLFPRAVAIRHAMLPSFSRRSFTDTVQDVLPQYGAKRGKVAFLTGCMMNVSMADIHEDAVEVVRRNGFEVAIPENQGCCGSLLAHFGGREDAKNLARALVGLFDVPDFDAIVVDSAGCSAYMKEYGTLFATDTELAGAAKRVASKTKDLTEFLSEAGFTHPAGEIQKRITYHDACHLVHTQKVSRPPREIVQSIPGATFVELPESSWCCGSAGVYNIVRTEDSMKFLERKMQNIRATNADIVVTGNPGCHVQLKYGIAMAGLKTEVMHPASLLRKAYEAGDAGPDEDGN